MSETNKTEPSMATAQSAAAAEPTPLIIEDLLVEDVSIDGMCGVY